MNLGGYTATGPREANEDNYFFFDFSNAVSFPNGVEALILVSDGMGGYQGGDVASKIVVDQSANYLKQLLDMAKQDPVDLDARAALAEIVDRAHATIVSEVEHVGRNMGATFVGAFVSETHAWIGHVGDSRAYLIRNGEAVQLTEDHSQVGRMLARGLITEEEAQNHPERNKIEQALGFTVDETSICEVDLLPDDAILLCSDGVYTALGNEKLATIVQPEGNAARASEKIVKAAISAGTDDNSTAVVAFPGRQPSKRRTGTLSEADRQKAISPHPRHGGVSTTSVHRRTRVDTIHNSPSLKTERLLSGRSLKSLLVPAIAGIVLLGIIIAIALNALGLNQGGSESAATGPAAIAESTSGAGLSSPANADTEIAETSGSEPQPQAAIDPSNALTSSKTVYYIDINDNIREFSKDDGLKSPDLIIQKGKAVSLGNGTATGENGDKFVYLDDSYVLDLLNDVDLYNSGSQSFTSALSQLFEPNAYLRTVEGIANFFRAGDETLNYGANDEIKHLLILEKSITDTQQQGTGETQGTAENEDGRASGGLGSATESQQAATVQSQGTSASQESNSTLGGIQEG